MAPAPIARRPSATYLDLAIVLGWTFVVLVLLSLFGSGVQLIVGRGMESFPILLPAFYAFFWFWRLYWPRAQRTTVSSASPTDDRRTVGDPPPLVEFRWTALRSAATVTPLLLINAALLAGLILSITLRVVPFVVPCAAAAIVGMIWLVPSVYRELRSAGGILRIDEQGITFVLQHAAINMPWNDIARGGLRTTRFVPQHHLILVPYDPRGTFRRMSEQSKNYAERYNALARRGADALAISLDAFVQPADVIMPALRRHFAYQAIPVMDLGVPR